jgi:kynurenine formamidase
VLIGTAAYAELVPQHADPDRVSATEFRALFAEVSTWTSRDGSLRHLTPERVVAATRLVRTGVTVSLGAPLDTEDGPANPQPAEHRMTQMPADDIGSGTVRFAKDYIGVDFHNDGHSHIDALSHVLYDNMLYGGLPAESITEAGADAGSIEALADGLVGRGVLLDLPGLRGVDWLEPGDQVRPDELREAEARQGVRVGPGDILLVRLGHSRRLAEVSAWDPGRHKAGLYPTTARFLAERHVAALGSDGNSDAVPTTTEGVDFPIHVLAVNAMGLHLMDYLRLERLTEACAAAGQWEFLVVVAPLRITGGTGSPVNPIAIF